MYGFSSIAYSLTTLIQKIKKFEWSEACEQCFQIFKDRHTTNLVFTLPEGTKVFIVYCYLFRVGLVCLMQQEKVLVYASRCILSNNQCLFSKRIL